MSDAIFSPNYFPLLWGMGSRLEPEEAARAGQIGGWWAGDDLQGYGEGHLHRRAEGKEGKEGKEVHFRVKVHFHLQSMWSLLVDPEGLCQQVRKQDLQLL